MTQLYVAEVQKYADGTYGHIIHYVYDDDPDMARLKGESKYHEVLAAAAISDLVTHSAILFDSECTPIFWQCYSHPITEPEEAT